MEYSIQRVKEINDQLSALNAEKRTLIEGLAASGFIKEKIDINGVTFTVSLDDHLQEDGGTYGSFVYVSRYGLRFYENKRKE